MARIQFSNEQRSVSEIKIQNGGLETVRRFFVYTNLMCRTISMICLITVKFVSASHFGLDNFKKIWVNRFESKQDVLVWTSVIRGKI